MEDLSPYLDTAIELSMSYAPKLILAIVTLIVGLTIINRVVSLAERTMRARAWSRPCNQSCPPRL